VKNSTQNFKNANPIAKLGQRIGTALLLIPIVLTPFVASAQTVEDRALGRDICRTGRPNKSGNAIVKLAPTRCTVGRMSIIAMSIYAGKVNGVPKYNNFVAAYLLRDGKPLSTAKIFQRDNSALTPELNTKFRNLRNIAIINGADSVNGTGGTIPKGQSFNGVTVLLTERGMQSLDKVPTNTRAEVILSLFGNRTLIKLLKRRDLGENITNNQTNRIIYNFPERNALAEEFNSQAFISLEN
jgi:hypothetical protein